MTGSIKTRQELYNAFADNNSGDITPEDVRDFVASNLSLQEERLNAPGTVIDFLTDICFLEAGANQVFIPQYVNYGARTLRLVNATGGLVTVDCEPGGTIAGQNPFPLPNGATIEISPSPTPLAWDIVLFADPLQPDAKSICAMANQNGNFQVGNSARWGNVTGSMFVVPFDGFITEISIGRSDADASGIDVIVNGLSQLVVPTSAMSTVQGGLAIPVSAGDSLEIDNDGPNTMSNVVVNVVIKELG